MAGPVPAIHVVPPERLSAAWAGSGGTAWITGSGPAVTRLRYFGAMRSAPSSRITSPFSITFSTMCRTSAAYSAGRPSRGG